ncbi:MAG: hypothetical protein Fur0021_28050 [Candidatus Promineifilaceae bacterium]
MNWQEWQDYANDERNWIDHDERGLLKAEHVRDYVLRLWFEEDMDVSIYELNLRPLLVENNPGGVFESLRDPERFRLVEGDYALIWPNPETGELDTAAIDIAPECIRFFCERYGRKLKTTHSGSSGVLIAA